MTISLSMVYHVYINKENGKGPPTLQINVCISWNMLSSKRNSGFH